MSHAAPWWKLHTTFVIYRYFVRSVNSVLWKIALVWYVQCARRCPACTGTTSTSCPWSTTASPSLAWISPLWPHLSGRLRYQCMYSTVPVHCFFLLQFSREPTVAVFYLTSTVVCLQSTKHNERKCFKLSRWEIQYSAWGTTSALQYLPF